MPTWGNTDAVNQKPKFDLARTTREVLQFKVLTGNTAGNNIIQVVYNDGAQNNVANVGVAAGQYVYFWANGFGVSGGQSGNGVPGFFKSNTTVSSVSGNTVTLSTNLFGTVTSSFGVEFDKGIVLNANKTASANYWADTILVTTTRSEVNGVGPGSNSAYSMGNVNVGWNRIVKKVNNDGTTRYLKETLVALASPTASNTSSGNTSWGQAFTGI
jgi:hypothetical protein